MKIGKHYNAVVESEMPQGFYVIADNERVLLPGNKAPKNLAVGDNLDVFIYTDSEDRLIATTQTPRVTANHFAVLEVKDVNNVGAFLDWGLDKDLFLPYKQQLGELEIGDRCVVYVLEDERSGRLVATEKIKSFIDTDIRSLQNGQKVELAVYDACEEYVDCLIDYRYTGRYYNTPNRANRLYIGDTLTGYIQNIREDGKVSLSLKPVGYKAMMDQSEQILQLLKEENGFLPYGDFSSPEEILEKFDLSKKAFKKIIGGLFKKGLIKLHDDGISLK